MMRAHLQTLTVLTALTLAGAAPAHAAFTLVDDFDSYTAGTDINGQGDWTSDSGANDVVADPDNASNNVLLIAGSESETSNDSINLPDGSTGTLFTRLRMASGTLNTNVGLAESAAPGANDYNDFRAQLQITSQVNARDGGAFETLQTQDTSPGTADVDDVWYNFWLVADNDTDTVRVYAQSNGDSDFAAQRELTSGVDAIDFRSAASALQSIYMRASGGSIHYDDLHFDADGANQINPTYEVVIDEDFDDGTADGFTVFDGSGGSNDPNFQVNSGIYQQTNSDMDTGSGTNLGGYALAEPNVSSFMLNIDVRLDDVINDPGNTAADAALVFGWQDTDNFYQILFNKDATFNEVFKVVDGVRTQIGGDFNSNDIEDGAFHNITLDRNIATGGISLFIDSDEVFHLTDFTFGAGRVGVGALNDAASFDNFYLATVPTPAALPAGLALMGMLTMRRKR